MGLPQRREWANTRGGRGCCVLLPTPPRPLSPADGEPLGSHPWAFVQFPLPGVSFPPSVGLIPECQAVLGSGSEHPDCAENLSLLHPAPAAVRGLGPCWHVGGGHGRVCGVQGARQASGPGALFLRGPAGWAGGGSALLPGAGGTTQDFAEVCGDAAQVGALPEDLATASAAEEVPQARPPQHTLRDPCQLQPGAVAQGGGGAGPQVGRLQPAAGQVIDVAPGGLLWGRACRGGSMALSAQPSSFRPPPHSFPRLLPTLPHPPNSASSYPRTPGPPLGYRPPPLT